MIDLRHVQSFVAVADARSFSVAARRLNTVQSAISNHIRLLEQQIKRPVLDRGRGRSVALTPEGRAFLIKARHLLALADELTLSEPAETPLRLGTTVTFALSTVPFAISALSRTLPNETVSVTTARSHELLGLLEDGAIDVAMMVDQGPHPGRFKTQEVNLAWAGVSNLLNDKTPLAFLSDARDLRRHALATLNNATTASMPIQTHTDPIGLRTALLAGVAISVLPEMAVVSPLHDVGKHKGLPALGQIPVAIYLSEKKAQPSMQKLAEHLATTIMKKP